MYLLDWTDETMVLKVQGKEITNYILKAFQQQMQATHIIKE